MQKGHHEGRQRIRFCSRGQVAFGLGPFEAFSQLLLAQRAKIDQRLAHRFGFVRSRWRPIHAQATAVLGDSVPDALLDQSPIRRIATLEEVAATVCFLAGPNGAYITGAGIDLAGGFGI